VPPSLADGKTLISASRQANALAGAKLLGDSGVSFDRWCSIAMALEEGRDPPLEPQEADALVKRNFVQRTYRLGVRS
jgi:hypothetical protein